MFVLQLEDLEEDLLSQKLGIFDLYQSEQVVKLAQINQFATVRSFDCRLDSCGCPVFTVRPVFSTFVQDIELLPKLCNEGELHAVFRKTPPAQYAIVNE